MFLFLRRFVARRVVTRLSSRYTRLPLWLGLLALARAAARRRSSRTAVITLKDNERLVVTREASRG